jgi:hypothetical protein
MIREMLNLTGTYRLRYQQLRCLYHLLNDKSVNPAIWQFRPMETITTIEGVSTEGEMNSLQEGLKENHDCIAVSAHQV